ncbi:heavy metal translocating P-type ATPase [Syntrophothermus lipocalidus]|uniref:Cd(2+)-exporting ATPase n=1 Tax=Syntrophothermus lipocalidus (strain DSM 12680 / TGB-C1) TaxID=643648 RepID=D7CLJ5_SYNLT|nr:heavy metal translocating P-type ATPase [Syntrophothermus lipocalidus]ADI01580.1 heavy metal translocating P-type ATPase [Syntrophothermus lipocalidus DSM 12680]
MDKAVTIPDAAFSADIYVRGIDCPDCAARVEQAVKGLPGVINAKVLVRSSKLAFLYDPALIEVEQVVSKVSELGYTTTKAEGCSNTGALAEGITSTIRIFGLDCGDCAAKLETGLRRIPGVKRAVVNLALSKVEVDHSGPLPEILKTIEAMGYTAKLEDRRLKSGFDGQNTATSKYALPTVLSGTMVAIGLFFGLLGLPDSIVSAAYLVAILFGGYLPARNGWAIIRSARELDMNVLVVIAVAGAVAIGRLEEAAAVVFLFSLGNTLQGYTFERTRSSIRALMELAPDEAVVRRDGREEVLSVQDIRIGDVVIVRPGERVPVDGRILEGTTFVNQAAITGESVPVEKKPGDEVLAGSINGMGALEVEVTRAAQDNTVSRIIRLVEQAQTQRAPSQQTVDRFARYYTPIVITAAILVAIVPPLGLHQPFNKWLYEALAMLLVACPCALVISTPVAVVAALGNAARNGVLIKGGGYLEEAGTLSVVAFDKTGTLTVGEPRVTDVVPLTATAQEVIQVAAAIEARSEHPLGEAITKYAKDAGIDAPAVSGFRSVPGRGAQGNIGDKRYHIGSERFIAELGISLAAARKDIARLQSCGKTVIIVGDDKRVLGLIATADTLREHSRAAVSKLKQLGIRKTVMLTGDNESTASAVGREVGIDEFRADLLPEGKLDVIRDLLAKYGKVAMVGDGVNDAPAMAASTVGIAMGAAGTDAALETADIALMADDLLKLPYTVKLSRKAVSIIRQNIAFSLLLKGIILLLVIPGWLTMWLAVAGDTGTSLLVTLNSMRLLRARD